MTAIEGIKPILALDVNGPVLVRGYDNSRGEFLETHVGSFPVAYSRRLPSRLAVLQRHYKIVWSTSYQGLANRLIAPLIGLPDDLPFLNFDHYRAAGCGETSKLPSFKVGLRDHAVAIVDDKVGSDLRTWALERGVLTLILEVDRRTGLQDRHVVELIAFARKVVDSRGC